MSNAAPGMRVPLLDLQAQYRPLRDEMLAAIARVCDSQQFILGAEVEALEADLSVVAGARHAVGVSSGTDALLAILMALGVGPGDEVVTSTYSFFATAGCVVRLGARPVLVDIDPVTFNLDPAAADAALTSRTRAIVPVHLFGQSADMDPILASARAHGAAVVEDACQAIGARYKGAPVGALGLAGCFSFFPSKNLGAFGEGGLVTSNDEAIARTVRLLRGHGMEPQYHHQMVGGNFRLDALQAAVLRVKAPHLAGWTEARRRNAARYARLFDAVRLLDDITLPVEADGSFHIYNQYVVRVPARDRLRTWLGAQGIGTEIYYPVPFHRQACFSDLGYAPGAFPQAEAAARDTLALPIYGELTEGQQEYVVRSMAAFYSGGSRPAPPTWA